MRRTDHGWQAMLQPRVAKATSTKDPSATRFFVVLKHSCKQVNIGLI